MPGFDGSGPRGRGPMTGRGEGYCVMVLPEPASMDVPHGFAGAGGRPAGLARPATPRVRHACWTVRWHPYLRPWRAQGFRLGLGWGRW
jgi:hypothetical protein